MTKTGFSMNTVLALAFACFLTLAHPSQAQSSMLLLGGSTIDAVASWADDYRRDHTRLGRGTTSTYPLADSKIDLARECPNGDCVIAKTGAVSRRPEGPQGRPDERKADDARVCDFAQGWSEPLRCAGAQTPDDVKPVRVRAI